VIRTDSTKAFAAERMCGEWKAPETESDSALRPASRASTATWSSSGRVTGEHDLPRGVVVGDHHAGTGEGLDVLAAAEHREHPTGPGLPAGPLHQPAALDDEREPVLLLERSRSDERGQLTERVPGHRDGRLVETVEPGEARAEDGGLGELRAVGDPREGVLADELGDAFEQVGPDRGDEVAHLGGLARLAGKEEGGGHADNLASIAANME
jgi:hypothetical protein